MCGTDHLRSMCVISQALPLQPLMKEMGAAAASKGAVIATSTIEEATTRSLRAAVLQVGNLICAVLAYAFGKADAAVHAKPKDA